MSSRARAAMATWAAWAATALVLSMLLSSVTWQQTLKTLTFGMGAWPVLDLIHGLAVAFDFRTSASPQGGPQRIVAICLTSLGGSMFMCFLVGQPCGWLCDNVTLPAYIVAWALLHHSPNDIVYRVFSRSPAVATVLRMLDDLTWGVAITTWGMEKTIGAAHLAPRGSAVAAILCGTIAGCGGGLLCDTASLMSTEWKLKTPQALRTVSFAPTTALCCCVLAYALRDPHNVVSPFMLHNAGVAFVPLQPEDVMVVAATLTCSVSTIRSTFEKLFENGKIV